MAEKLSSVVKEDGVYKRSEINKAISIMETKDLGELK